jgi:hypothetical protein
MDTMKPTATSAATALKLVGLTVALGLLLLNTGCGSSNTPSSDGSSTVVAATTLSTLAITPSTSSVTYSQQVTLAVSGGTAPYTFNFLTPSLGTFTATSATGGLYIAPSAATGTAEVEVIDAANNITYAYIYVSSTSSGTTLTTTGTCAGTFSYIASSYGGTLTLIEDGNGNLAGNLTYTSGTSGTISLTGTCSGTTINLTAIGTTKTQTWTGNVLINANNSSQVFFNGTWTTGATSTTWFASE